MSTRSPSRTRRTLSRGGSAIHSPLPVPGATKTVQAALAGDPEPGSVARTQAALQAMAGRIKDDLTLLKRIHRSLVPPPDFDDRQEHRKPYDVTTELIGGIETLCFETLPDLIKDLRRLACATDEKLARNFEEINAWWMTGSRLPTPRRRRAPTSVAHTRGDSEDGTHR